MVYRLRFHSLSLAEDPVPLGCISNSFNMTGLTTLPAEGSNPYVKDGTFQRLTNTVIYSQILHH